MTIRAIVLVPFDAMLVRSATSEEGDRVSSMSNLKRWRYWICAGERF